MWQLTYKILLWLAYPIVRARLKLRARRAPAYAERVSERFGKVGETVPRNALWVHTVSAGETIAAAPLVRRLVKAYPRADGGAAVLVTTMTPTGSEAVATLLGDVVAHCYAPYDFEFAVRRFVARTQPRALILR